VAQYSTFGRHVTMDLREVSFEKLNDAKYLREVMVEAAERCGATIVGENFVEFDPQGVTGVLVLSESHLSIHTYPEEGFAAIDCYTCGQTVDPEIACDYLKAALGGRVAGYRALQRGTGPIVDLPQLRLATAN
jgi:S-adenosylmethionine decarboxylase